VVKTDDPKDYEKVITIISSPEIASLIEDKTFADTQTAIEKISTITSRVQQFALAISIIFGLMAVIIVFTTIRVAIYTERVEIAVKKLVGASNWFIRGPYIVESIILSIVSLVLALGVIFMSAQAIDPYILPLVGNEYLLTNYFLGHILIIVTLEFCAVAALTIFTSLIAMRQYLRA
jgi:cell division transport system permease protein